jgi:hypothetical protein
LDNIKVENQIKFINSNRNNQQEIKSEKEIQTGEDFYKNQEADNCSLCKSAKFIDTKVRFKKKENPCLLEPSEIK